MIDDELAILLATWDAQELLRRRILRRARSLATRLSRAHGLALDEELTAARADHFPSRR